MQSTARTLSPASTFTLTQHPVHDAGSEEDKRFAILAVHHSARNNLDEDLQRAADAELGSCGLAQDLQAKSPSRASIPGASSYQNNSRGADKPRRNNATGNAEGDIPHYRNRFTAVRAATPTAP